MDSEPPVVTASPLPAAPGAGRRPRSRRRWVVVLVLVAHLAGALTSLRALLEVRTSQGTIAWMVSLNTFPYLAVPAYWVLGRSRFHGYVVERRQLLERRDPAAVRFLEDLREQKLIAFPDRDHALSVEKLAKLPFTSGNEAELLIDGQATFDSILAGIERAREYVLVQYYILRADDIGNELARRLIERARAGVRCYVLYDEVGNRPPRAYREELEAAGIAVHAFQTTRGDSNRFQLNFRNHRKIVVVDGREAWVGGLNVGDEYLGRDPDIGPWRDVHVRVAGPVVQCVQVSFCEDWRWATDELLELDWEPRPATAEHTVEALCLPSGPADRLETATLFFMAAIEHARRRLWIASPYFVPDTQFVTALQLAALRGVDVRILMPDASDSTLVDLAGWAQLEALESAGVELMRYTPGFMHHKVLVIDEEFCTIGTANFDNRSFRLNFEVTMAFADADFTARVAAMLERDFTRARPMTGAELEQRGPWFRLGVRAANLFAPVL